jgi:ribosomal protein S18 acetylase RimI-like enzyme
MADPAPAYHGPVSAEPTKNGGPATSPDGEGAPAVVGSAPATNGHGGEPAVAGSPGTNGHGGEPAATTPPPRRARKKARQVGSARLVVDVPEVESDKGRRRRGGRETREPLPLLRTERVAKQGEPRIEVRRMHRRDLNRVWEFLKVSFRDVNLATVEYQRPRSKSRFAETYEDEGVDQLLFEVDSEIVAYAECAHEIAGSDTWLNPRYFEKRDMRPLYVEEIAVHPEWHGNGVGSFVLEQLHHLAKVRGLTHLVLEVAENNENALTWYRKRGFRKLDAAIFLAHSVEAEPELLPPRSIETRSDAAAADSQASEGEGTPARPSAKKRARRPRR